jgi:predicted Zn finger-like uncharacterized protein
MYTQCPECQIAFRVTASVLQQASGNVRCGNCSHAFNALHYLSEEMPASPTTEDDSTEDLSHDELAETSRRLLETLDELAGPEDVRIEDTGVEWRVLDEAAMDAAAVDRAPVEELRYDDNTPLPDDYDDLAHFEPTPAPPSPEEESAAQSTGTDDPQCDIALSDPEDWTDILEEVRDPAADALEVEEELAAIHGELSAIDDALTDEVPQLEDDEPVLAEAPESSEPEASTESDDMDAAESAHGQIEVDFELGDDEDTGIFEAAGEENGGGTGDHEFAGVFELANDDTDIDVDLALGEEDPATDLDEERVAWDADEQVADEAESAVTVDENDDGDDDQEVTTLFDEDSEDEAADDAEDVIDEEDSLIETLELASGDEPDIDDGEYLADAGLEQEIRFESLDDKSAEDDAEPALAAASDQADDEAGKDEEEPDDDEDFTARLMSLENPEALFDESSGEVETIIMEGEFVRSEIERERIAAENAARSQLDDPIQPADTYSISRDKLRGGRRSYDPPSHRMLAALVGLSLLLVAQLVHNSRQSLATNGFFSRTIAPIYRLLGSPVTPAWDIRGWQFEATNGSVDEDETALTIVSRIVNRSEEPLPYPLVHLSLTNRYEDVMGSRVLEPGEYLPGDLDPSRPVPPGDDFTAVLEVDDPSPDATGFKLNVCYRVQPGTVRCAIEDFKN